MGRRFPVGSSHVFVVGDPVFTGELDGAFLDEMLEAGARAGRFLPFRLEDERELELDVSLADTPTPRPDRARPLVRDAFLSLPSGRLAVPLSSRAEEKQAFDLPAGDYLVEVWHDPAPNSGYRLLSNRSCLLLALLANLWLAGIALPRKEGVPVLVGALVLSLAWWIVARVRRLRNPPPPRSPDFFLVLVPVAPEADRAQLGGAIVEQGWSARRA